LHFIIIITSFPIESTTVYAHQNGHASTATVSQETFLPPPSDGGEHVGLDIERAEVLFRDAIRVA
jgi:hypothetical protein